VPTNVFHASRWTRGNHLFPTIIEVSEKAVTLRKRTWFTHDEISVSISKVASVHIKTGFVWSTILIESSGGADPLTSHGHTKTDAKRIKELIEDHQASYAKQDDEAPRRQGPLVQDAVPPDTMEIWEGSIVWCTGPSTKV